MTYTNNTLTRAHITFDALAVPDAVQIMAAAQLPRHPIGVNVRQDADWGKLLAYVQQQGGLRSMLLHVDSGALSRAHDFLPHVSILVWRDRETADEKLRTKAPNPERWIDDRIADIRAAGLTIEQVWVHLHNEAAWGAELIEWERRATLHAVNKGARVVVLNCAVGTPEPAQIVMARPLIELAAAYPHKVIVGLHEYMSVYGTRSAPWYLNRWSFWEHYRQQAGIGPVRYLITEFGTEDISDDHPFTDKLPRTGGRKHVGPVHANDAAWQATYNDVAHHNSPKPYPGKDRAYYEQIVTAYSIGDYESDCIEAVLLFSWGHDNGRWSDYDVQPMTTLHELLAQWDNREKEPLPVVTPPPVDIAWVEATLEAGTQPNGEPGTIFVRPQPAAAEWVAIPKDGDPIWYKPEPVKTASRNGVSYKWLYVRTKDDVEGWMALVMPGATPEKPGAQFIPKPAIPPVEKPEDPPPPPPDDLPNDAPATIHDVDKLRADVIAYIDLQGAVLRAELDKVRAEKDTLANRVDALERVLRGFGVHIENELKIA